MNKFKMKLGANIIFVSDVSKAKAWYEKNFGMVTVEFRPPEFLEMKLGGATFYIETENPKRAEGFKEVKVGGNCSAIIGVSNINEAVASLKKNGVKVLVEPVKQFWGGWNAKIEDPDGNIFTLDEDVEDATVTFDEFAKIEIKAGKILSADKIPDTDKLLKLSVDFGLKPAPAAAAGAGSPEHSTRQNVLGIKDVAAPAAGAAELPPEKDIRQIISGISVYFPDPSVLVGKTCMFVTNLESRTIRGFESNGMLFAVSTPEGAFSLLEPTGDIPPGTRAK